MWTDATRKQFARSGLRLPSGVHFHPEGPGYGVNRDWLDHGGPSELSRLAGELGFEFLGGSVTEG